jgi:hypothetical protein
MSLGLRPQILKKEVSFDQTFEFTHFVLRLAPLEVWLMGEKG